MEQYNQQKLNTELESFQNIWSGGYLTGYSEKRNQKGLERYLSENLSGKTFLEIGCGGGQWSKFIHDQGVFDVMYCIDALSEDHNNFWDNLGEQAKDTIDYKKVDNFSLDFIEDNSLDFVFSYDVFCHISLSGTKAYLNALSKKCKNGSKLLIMYADPKKYIESEPENRFHLKRYLPSSKFAYNISNKKLIQDALADSDGKASEGRWYWIGSELFIKLLNNSGFKIISEDINIDNTNVITLFEK